MSKEVMVLTKKDLESNPSIIGENIAQLAYAIEDTKANLSSIQNRSFWQRLTNNNTRDLAEAMIKQNDTISAFLTIVQGVIFLSLNNLVVLGGIMDALNKQEKTNNYRDNKYVGMAKEYLTEAIKSAQKLSSNEKEIAKVKNDLISYYKNQSNQQKLLADLKEELKNNKLSDEQQDKIILTLTNRLNNKDNMDKQQDMIIEQLLTEMKEQDIEDKRQAEIIEFVKTEISNQEAEDKRQARLIDEITKELKEKKKLDEEQNKRLLELQKSTEITKKLIEEQDIEDKRQAQLIELLEETLKKNEALIQQQDLEDKRQADLIDKLMSELKELKEENNAIQASMGEGAKELKSKLMVAYTLGGVAAAISVFAIILNYV